MAQKRRVIPEGYKNGYLEYVREAPDRRNNYQLVRYVVARCVCGDESEYVMVNFYGGRTKSCGCMSAEMRFKTLDIINRERKDIVRDLNIMREIALAADKKREAEMTERIGRAESELDFAGMMEWTLLFLDRGDKREILKKEEEETVGNFVFK